MVLSVHTFIFADLCGYTEDTWLYGDDWSADVAVGFQDGLDFTGQGGTIGGGEGGLPLRLVIRGSDQRIEDAETKRGAAKHGN